MSIKKSTPPRSDIPQNIGNPAQRALEGAGYTKLKQLAEVTESELHRLHGMGPKVLRILREALEAKGMSFASRSKVDLYMADLDHPFKAEVEALRNIIKSTNKEITEQVKWNAPSYSYRGEYLVTFNLRETKRIHLVFHNPMIPQIKSPLLEGTYVDRRMTYFSGMKDIQTKQAEFKAILKKLVELNKK